MSPVSPVSTMGVRAARGSDWPPEMQALIEREADRFAYRLLPDMSLEDLRSAATVAVLEAMSGWDPADSQGIMDQARAAARQGILREFRAHPVVPEPIHTRVGTLRAAHLQLLTTLGRLPTDEELAEQLGLTCDELDSWIRSCRPLIVLRLHDLQPPDMSGGAFPSMGMLRRTIARAVATLSPQQQRVINLVYYHELTMKECGGILGISEARVSQLHARAILHLQAAARAHGITSAA